MTSPTAFLKKIKRKVAVAATGATLIAMPGGIALAHGNYQHRDNQRHDGYHRSHNNDNDNRRSDRRANCDERQARADQAVANFKSRTQQHFDGLNIYLTNQQTFVADNNVNVDNYDRLNAKVTYKQAKTAQALENIESPTIDCDRSARHDRYQVFKAEHELRQAIKKYEAAVNHLSIAIADDVKSS